MRHIILISGKDSLATAIIQKAKDDTLPYEYVYNPTGAELPEVNTWLTDIEEYLHATINRVGEDLISIIQNYNFLPSPIARYCTRKSKIEPLGKYIGKGRGIATVYYGLRYDEQYRVGYEPIQKSPIIPKYPLREAHMTLPMVWALLDSLKLLPPMFIWDEMYDRVKVLLGDNSEILENLRPW